MGQTKSDEPAISAIDRVVEFAFSESLGMKHPLVVVDGVIWNDLMKAVRQQTTHPVLDPKELILRIAAFEVVPCLFPIRGMFCVEDSVWRKAKESMSMMVFPIPGVNMSPDWTWMAKGISKPDDTPDEAEEAAPVEAGGEGPYMVRLDGDGFPFVEKTIFSTTGHLESKRLAQMFVDDLNAAYRAGQASRPSAPTNEQPEHGDAMPMGEVRKMLEEIRTAPGLLGETSWTIQAIAARYGITNL